MERDKNSLTSLKDILGNLLSNGSLPFNPDDADIWKFWNEVVGSAISKNAKPSRIKNGVLRVTVSDPIWLQELQFIEENIRKRLNDKLGRKAVREVEFRVGPESET
jgi:predicted nucleic acid-binding Zn ribbon protein